MRVSKEIMYGSLCPYGSDSYEGREILEVQCGINTLEEQLEEKFYQVPIAPIS